MLTPVKRTLAGVRLYPHREIEHLTVDRVAGFDELADMAPVHADIMQGTVPRDCCGLPERAFEECDKIRAGELAGCHGEFGVLDLATADNVAHANIVRWIQKGHRGEI